MADVVIDIVEASRWREERGRVREIARTAILTGLEPTTPALLCGAALNELTARGYTARSSHPSPPAGLLLVHRNPRALGPTSAIVELIYQLPEVADAPGGLSYSVNVTGGTVLEQVTTQIYNNQQIVVQDAQGTKQGGEITVLEPRTSLVFTRYENSQTPGAVSQLYTGAVNNNAPWYGGQVRTWLCTSVGFTIEDSSRTPPLWEMRYEFAYNVNGHDPSVIFIDPDTGKPPPNLTEGVGWKTIPYYPEISFAGLF